MQGRSPVYHTELRRRLNRLREIKVECRMLRNRIARWEDEATRITSSYGNNPASRGGAPDRRAELVAKIVDARREYEAEIAEKLDEEKETLALIHMLPEGRHRTALELYYVDCLRWEDVAEEMHYAPTYMRRLHIAALDMLQKMLDNAH